MFFLMNLQYSHLINDNYSISYAKCVNLSFLPQQFLKGTVCFEVGNF